MGEFLLEFILELVFEGADAASRSPRIPRWIRILLAAVIGLFFFSVSALVLVVGIGMVREKSFSGILFFLLGAAMLGYCVFRVREILRRREGQGSGRT